MSKSDKTMFYYLGLSLLLLIVLGVLFGISSVKESFGRKRQWKKNLKVWRKVNKCKSEGVNLAKAVANRSMGDPDPTRRLNWEDEELQTSIVNEIGEKCANHADDYTWSKAKETGRGYALEVHADRAGWYN